MEDTKIGRREMFTAGAVAAVGMTVLPTGASAQDADPGTIITDSLGGEHIALLTDAAAAISEGDAVLLNRALRDPDSPLPESLVHLTTMDVKSLHAAFQSSHENTYDLSSLSPSLVGVAHAGGVSCCCCTPASCCCAAAQSVPSRSRQIA